jgi:two-component system, NarL family, sensor kinase
MKQFFLFVVLCIVCNVLQAQAHWNKDSLFAELKSAKTDKEKVKLYFDISKRLFNEDLKEAEKYSILGGALSRKINYSEGVLVYFTSYSNILVYKGLLDSALKINLEAVEYAENNADSTEMGRTMLNVGTAYARLEQYENAVFYVEKGRDIFIRNGIKQYDADILNILQWLYFYMHQYRKAVNNGLQSVKMLEQVDNKFSLQEAYNNLGLNYIHLHQYDSARYYLDKAVAVANITGESLIQITTNLNYALLSLRQNQVDSIKNYVDKALVLTRKYDASEYKGLALYGLAYYYLLKKDYNSCRVVADSALVLANQYNLRDVKQKVYGVLSGMYYALQDTKHGYYYFNQYELLSDSVLNFSVTNSTIHIEKKYETERKETQIKLQQTQLRQKNILNYLLITAAVGLLVISLLTYRNYKGRQKLQQAKIEELETEKQLTATEAVLKGEEQERSRLAKDLHDGLGGMLSGIKHSLSSMKENLIMTPDNARAFERSIDMLNSSISEMRRVAHNLMPEMLVKYGLDTALREFSNEMTGSGITKVNYQSIGMDNAVIEQTAAVAIYRSTQELVNNAIKHGNANEVLVQLHLYKQEKILALTVEDDGKGMNVDVLKQSNGIGWKNIQNRVDFLQGKLDVQSEPGNGTSVMIEIKI